MNVQRRSLLKGMALGGFAGLTLGSPLSFAAGAGAASAAHPPLVLVSEAAVGSAFLQGIDASAAGKPLEVQRTDLGLEFVGAVGQRLRSARPTRIIGLVDDASATLIVDLARSAGARLQWLGQHAVEAGQSRHRLLSSEATHGCALQLGQHLKACGAGFRLSEQRVQSGQTTLELAMPGQSRASGQWAASLGFVLASLGRFDGATAPKLAATSAPAIGNFVSFSIET